MRTLVAGSVASDHNSSARWRRLFGPSIDRYASNNSSLGRWKVLPSSSSLPSVRRYIGGDYSAAFYARFTAAGALSCVKPEGGSRCHIAQALKPHYVRLDTLHSGAPAASASSSCWPCSVRPAVDKVPPATLRQMGR